MTVEVVSVEPMVVEVQAGSVIVDAAAVAHATRHKHGGLDEVASSTPSANVIPKADATGKLAAGFIPTGLISGGVSTLDDLSDGDTYARTLKTIADALNAGTYDAAKCTAFGIGGIVEKNAVDINTLTTNGLYKTLNCTNVPGSLGWGMLLVVGYATDYLYQLYVPIGGSGVNTDCLYMRRMENGTWLVPSGAEGVKGWFKIWGVGNDGNGGQPPAPKPKAWTAGATVGEYTYDYTGAGQAYVLPPTGGTYSYHMIRYTATGAWSAEIAGTAAGGAEIGTANSTDVWRGAICRIA